MKGKDVPTAVRQAFTQELLYTRPDLTSNVLDGADVPLSIRAYPMIQYIDPTTGKTRMIGASPGFLETFISADAKQTSPLTRQAVESPLDFGSGVCISLAELTIEANRAFGRKLSCDPRVRDRMVFVSGRMTFDALAESMKRLTTVNSSMEMPRHRNQGESVDLAYTHLFGALADKPMKASQAIQMYPAISAVFKILGLAPNAMVTVKPGIAVYATYGGIGKLLSPEGAPVVRYSTSGSVILSP